MKRFTLLSKYIFAITLGLLLNSNNTLSGLNNKFNEELENVVNADAKQKVHTLNIAISFLDEIANLELDSIFIDNNLSENVKNIIKIIEESSINNKFVEEVIAVLVLKVSFAAILEKIANLTFNELTSGNNNILKILTKALNAKLENINWLNNGAKLKNTDTLNVFNNNNFECQKLYTTAIFPILDNISSFLSKMGTFANNTIKQFTDFAAVNEKNSKDTREKAAYRAYLLATSPIFIIQDINNNKPMTFTKFLSKITNIISNKMQDKISNAVEQAKNNILNLANKTDNFHDESINETAKDLKNKVTEKLGGIITENISDTLQDLQEENHANLDIYNF